MSQTPLSIVIPLYNKQHSILRAVNSILAQSFENFELIVIDDGSTDESKKLVMKLNDHRIRLISQSNQGVSAARNRGLKESKTDHICFLDADDEWHPDFLSEILNLIKEFPEAVLYCVRHQKVSETGTIFKHTVPFPDNFRGIVDDFPDKYRKGYGIINSSSVCIKRSLFNQGHVFPEGEKSGEDIYYWLRASQLGQVAFSNKTLSTIHLESQNEYKPGRNSLPYHIRWYIYEKEHILQGKHGVSIAKFIITNALIQAYGNIAKGNYELSRTIINEFYKEGDILSGLFIPALFCPPCVARYMQLKRRKASK